DETVKAIFEQNSFILRNRENYNGKIGMDYYASKKTTLGLVFTGYTTPGTEDINSTSYLQNSGSIVDSIVTAKNREKSTWRSGAINLNAKHTFDSTGRELTADLDYAKYSANKNQRFLNDSYNPDWTKKTHDQLDSDLPSDIQIYSAKLDYTQNLKKTGIKLESGLKFSYVSTDNTAGYFNVIDGSKEIDYDKTNRFQYKENINAGYINFSKSIKKWGFQAGLRVENTNYSGKQFGNPMHTDSSFSNEYTNAFPTGYVSYNANEKNQFGLSYGRRISRPDYEDLNPFMFFLDKYTYGAGNPFLKPMYSNVFEASHTYKQFLTTTLNYGIAKDLFTETFEQKDFATIVRQGNYGKRENANLSVNAQLKPKKWWSLMIYTAGDYQHYTGVLYGNPIDAKATTWMMNVNNQFNFKKGWAAELSGFYRTAGIEGQIKIQSISQFNAGVSKQVLKSKGTLKLAIKDFTGPMNPHGNINFQNTKASFSQTSDNRVVTVSFNYRFGKPIKGLQKRKTGGAGDEQDRVKSAN
ncbi:MAG: outer membrane beta-barrel family protein, partial [Ferruginibacter sp.]